MKERIEDKIREIEEFLEFLSARIPKTLEEYQADLEKKAICERYIEKIVEASVDLAFLIVRHKNIELSPQTTEQNILGILADRGIISSSLSEKLQDAKGMRNIIAHEYGKINDEIVYESISFELEGDINEFILKAREAIK